MIFPFEHRRYLEFIYVMVAMEKSCKYIARIAKTERDVQLTQAMRAAQFGCGLQDADLFDAKCQHVLIEDTETGTLVGCFRFMAFTSGQELSRSYSAQFYDLQRLAAYNQPMLELGRFCVSGRGAGLCGVACGLGLSDPLCGSAQYRADLWLCFF